MESNAPELTVTSVGVIHSPFRRARGTPIQPVFAGGAEGWVEVFEPFAAGLKDLEGFERIWLLYWFHRAERNGKLIVTPYLDSTPRGVFSTRAPSRPNPIGLSCVKLLGVDHNTLQVQGIDVLDGTPVVDIKPYVPRFDCFEGVRAGWFESVTSGSGVADGRFEKADG